MIEWLDDDTNFFLLFYQFYLHMYTYIHLQRVKLYSNMFLDIMEKIIIHNIQYYTIFVLS